MTASNLMKSFGICVLALAVLGLRLDAQQPGDLSEAPSISTNFSDSTDIGNTPESVPGNDDNSSLDDLDALLDTDVTQLRNTRVAPAFEVEVSTVSRQKSTVGKSPTAVTVINQEMIRRSGARTLPDLLRMVPGVHVGRMNSGRWSVSSRGFVDNYNQDLLVQIDGRSVYTPIFGGVIWSWHDLLLDDIERIEVIRGPGSTVWGANAVNGVINIITKSSADTHGRFLEGGGGTEDLGFAGIRLGGQTAKGMNWRVSGKWFDRGPGFEPSGLAFDGWQQGRVNMRTDWKSSETDSQTFQGGVFQGQTGVGFGNAFFPLAVNDSPASGGNMLYRFNRKHSEDSDTSFQVWSDHYDSGNQFDIVYAKQTTVDVDLNHRFCWKDNHRIIAGMGYRNVWDDLQTTSGFPIVAFTPVQRSTYIASAFVQDEIEMVPEKLFFTAGAKISQNSFSGFEVQPSLRLLSVIDDRSVGWCAVSRAVRIPTRTDSNVDVVLIPGLVNAVGNPNIDSEAMLAYELGFRRQPNKNFSWDATVFYNDYNDLVTYTFVNPATLLALNLQDVNSVGAEIAGEWSVHDDWKIRSWYSYLYLREKHALPSPDPITAPRSQAFLMSTYNLNETCDLDLIVRYVDDLRNSNVGAYIQSDLRFAKRFNDHVELSIVGQNLLDPHHQEAIGSPFIPEISTLAERGVYGMLQIRY